MSHLDELLDLYQQWRDLSEKEGGAITVGEWKCVDSCQETKRRLQDQISEAWERLRAKAAHERRDWREIASQVRPRINELLAFEERNAAWLALQRQKAAALDQQQRQSAKTLRQLQQAYGPENCSCRFGYAMMGNWENSLGIPPHDETLLKRH